MEENPHPPAQRKWYRRPGCLIAVVIASLPLLLISYAVFHDWYEANRPTYYEQAGDFPVDDLPASARDIHYCPHTPFSPLGRTYEFKCSEQDYRDWVRKTKVKRTELSEIREGEPLRGEDFPAIAKDGTVTWIKTEDYLISDWIFEDQGIYLIYNREAGKAIRWSHSR